MGRSVPDIGPQINSEAAEWAGTLHGPGEMQCESERVTCSNDTRPAHHHNTAHGPQIIFIFNIFSGGEEEKGGVAVA